MALVWRARQTSMAFGGLISVLWTSYLLMSSVVATVEPGFVPVDPLPGSEDVCLKRELSFICTTTGSGDTLLMFEENSTLIAQYKHSLYSYGMPNQNQNEDLHVHDVELRVGNLSKSNSTACYNERHNTITCYTTSLAVQVKSGTDCGVIICSTVFRNGTSGNIPDEFGRIVLARIPPPPSNLHVEDQSSNNLTFSWNAGTSTDCPTIQYEVSVLNCGNCQMKLNTSNNSVTCNNVVPGQECNITVRSMLECGLFSNSTTIKFVVPEATATTNDVGTTIGIAVGVTVFLLLMLFIRGLSIIGSCIYFNKKKSLIHSYSPGTAPEHVVDAEVDKEAETSFNGDETLVSQDTAANITMNSNQEQLLLPHDTSNSLTHHSEESIIEESTEQGPKLTAATHAPTFAKKPPMPSRIDDTDDVRELPSVPKPRPFTSLPDTKDANAAASLVTSSESDVKEKPPKSKHNLSERKKPLSKKPTCDDSDDEDGQSQADDTNEAEQLSNVGGTDLSDDVRELNKSVRDLRANQLEMDKELKEARKERKEAKKEREEARKEREELKCEAQRDRKQCLAKIVELNTKIKHLEDQLNEMNRINKALEEKSEAERLRHEQEERKLRNEIKKLQRQLKIANARIKELEEGRDIQSPNCEDLAPD